MDRTTIIATHEDEINALVVQMQKEKILKEEAARRLAILEKEATQRAAITAQLAAEEEAFQARKAQLASCGGGGGAPAEVAAAAAGAGQETPKKAAKAAPSPLTLMPTVDFQGKTYYINRKTRNLYDPASKDISYVGRLSADGKAIDFEVGEKELDAQLEVAALRSANPSSKEEPANPSSEQEPANPSSEQEPANPSSEQEPANPSSEQELLARTKESLQQNVANFAAMAARAAFYGPATREGYNHAKVMWEKQGQWAQASLDALEGKPILPSLAASIIENRIKMHACLEFESKLCPPRDAVAHAKHAVAIASHELILSALRAASA